MDKNPIFIMNTAAPTIKTTSQRIILNFSGGLARHDTLEGRAHIVVPMVMALEGVLNGSQGAMYYPADELKNSCSVWNHKPVVVYHPTDKDGDGITACDPDVLTNRKIGVILNTRFEDNKLKADAWIEPDRVKLIDNRIMEALDKNEMIELSTGLEVQIENTAGEFNNIPYVGIVRNFKPDHLAVLPDKEGACSINDGAGFLRNQVDKDKKKKKDEVIVVDNEMSHGTLRDLLWQLLNQVDEDAWIEDVFDNFFVYMSDGKFWKYSYLEQEPGVVVLVGSPEQVVRVTEYRTLDGTFVGNKKENEMDKEKFVNDLIANEKSSWEADDKEALLAMPEAQLKKLEVNEEPAPELDKKEDKKKEDEVEAPPVVNTQGKTESQVLDEYIKNAPSNYGEVIRSGLRTLENQKRELVAAILANEANVFEEKVLINKSLEELQGIAALAAVNTPAANSGGPQFMGLGEVASIVGNASKEGALVMPEVDLG